MKLTGFCKFIFMVSLAVFITGLPPHLYAATPREDTMKPLLDSLAQAKKSGSLANIIACEKAASSGYAAEQKWQLSILALKECAMYSDSLANMNLRLQLKQIAEKELLARSLAVKKAEADTKEAISSANLKFKLYLAGLVLACVLSIILVSLQIVRYRRAVSNNKKATAA